MQDYEKLGQFYLGRKYNLEAGKPTDDLVLYDSKDLTTHAVCVGMTGSGKTGLCLALLEEAAIDGIPAICIDPKGDLGNLLLTFPDFSPESYRPWVDQAEATRQGITPDELAQKFASRWKSGLADWGQDGARIQRFRDSVDFSIYTPGSTAGLPMTVLRSFSVPSANILQNSEALREKINGAVSGLLALLSIEADPLRSREHILLSNILHAAWTTGKNVDLGSLIREIQSPPFDKVGFVDLESFYPSKERFALAMSLNNLLASPGFSAWMEGEPLDIQRLLYTSSGKPRLSIISIAHLSDSERMFFVTILLNEMISWMRSQSGTSSLRALLYMDEVFGYFPPTANPPTKTPMLTLLKQARAFGLGVVLATQNPVDLDYKGLSNAGTWFLGRLQTERDKARVLDGLEGASTAAGANFDRQKMEGILSGLGNRVFLMNNVHEDQPVVFQSRWALSFLRGPVNREQISMLMAPKKKLAPPPPPARPGETGSSSGQRPILPPEVTELFLARRAALSGGAKIHYMPAVLGTARIHFIKATMGVDTWRDLALLLPIEGDAADLHWDSAEMREGDLPEFDSSPEPNASFASLSSAFSRAKKYVEMGNLLKDHLYRTQSLTIWKCGSVKATSEPGENEGDFRARLAHSAKEARDLQIEKLRQKFGPKLATIQEQIRKAEQKVEKEKSQANSQTFQAAIAVGSTILGAVLGRKVVSSTNMTKAASTVRATQRVLEQRQDMSHAEDSVEALQEKYTALDADFQSELEKVEAATSTDALSLTEATVAAKKADITITRSALVWAPFRLTPNGQLSPAF